MPSREAWISTQWQQRGLFACLLWPLSLLFSALAALRRGAYRCGLLKSWRAPVPLVIVGNLTVGGTGKSPLVLALAEALHAAGYRPGIISRGYGATITQPLVIQTSHSAAEVGDEPLMLFQALRTLQIPVAVHPQRAAAAQTLLAAHLDCNVLLCDDGLQHYALQRRAGYAGGADVEILVFDGRVAGNGWRMPAGPLREGLQRAADLVFLNQANPHATLPARQTQQLAQLQAPIFPVTLALQSAYALHDPTQRKPLSELAALQAQGHRFLAAAGIGHPERFFNALVAAGFAQDRLQTLPLPDHFDFAQNPFPAPGAADSPDYILITGKDAVKCQAYRAMHADTRLWVVPARVTLPPDSVARVLEILKGSRRG